MQQHVDKLRGLLAGGLDRDDALRQLRDGGVPPAVCVKALQQLQTLDIAEAKTLVHRLRSMPPGGDGATHALRSTDVSPREAVVLALAALTDSPVDVETVVDQGSWYSRFTAREGQVLWRFELERSAWCLLAAPAWSPDEAFDADLLARHFFGRSLSVESVGVDAWTPRTAADLVTMLSAVRRPVLAGFREETWTWVRARLERLARQRNHEPLGGVAPPNETP